VHTLFGKSTFTSFRLALDLNRGGVESVQGSEMALLEVAVGGFGLSTNRGSDLTVDIFARPS
jgi:hypothetical protein